MDDSMFIRANKEHHEVVYECFGDERVMFIGTLSECIDWTNRHTFIGSEC